MEYVAFWDDWGIMGIPQYSPIFPNIWGQEITTSMGKIRESLGWRQTNILGSKGDKSPQKTLISRWGRGDHYWGIWTL